MNESKILQFAQNHGYKFVKPAGRWKEYDLFYPLMDEVGDELTGQPLALLVQGDEIRFSTIEEAYQILDDMNA